MKLEGVPIAVTGANGFIGRNLTVRLREQGGIVHAIGRDTPEDEARRALAAADIVFHLAGANRPKDPGDFFRVNRDYSAWVAQAIAAGGKRPLVVVSSSIKATDDSDYGRSKLAGEATMLSLGDAATVSVWRLPNVFGKWAFPDGNSAVATFCHRVARCEPIRIDDPAAALPLLHIDDLIDQWFALIDGPPTLSGAVEPIGVHLTTVGKVADMIQAFAAGRELGEIGQVGARLERALYATFVSYLPEGDFSYPLTAHIDPRGTFVEMLKTPASGQFSYFTAHPGVTRGGHYHHSKVEKFLIVHGTARFRFRHILTDARHEVIASAAQPMVVETVPGWTHDVTNIGDTEMVALVWANEVFDRDRPDTVGMPV